MELQGPERTAVAVAAMSWEMLEPSERAAAYLAATVGGRRMIPPHNIAFEKARKLMLVEEDGGMHDLCRGLEVAIARDHENREAADGRS